MICYILKMKYQYSGKQSLVCHQYSGKQLGTYVPGEIGISAPNIFEEKYFSPNVIAAYFEKIDLVVLLLL